MESGLAHVRSLLGSAADSGLSDKEVKDSLWYYFFDAEQTVEYLLAEKEKNAKKGKKNGECPPVLALSFAAVLPAALGGKGAEGWEDDGAHRSRSG